MIRRDSPEEHELLRTYVRRAPPYKGDPLPGKSLPESTTTFHEVLKLHHDLLKISTLAVVGRLRCLASPSCTPDPSSNNVPAYQTSIFDTGHLLNGESPGFFSVRFSLPGSPYASVGDVLDPTVFYPGSSFLLFLKGTPSDLSPSLLPEMTDYEMYLINLQMGITPIGGAIAMRYSPATKDTSVYLVTPEQGRYIEKQLRVAPAHSEY